MTQEKFARELISLIRNEYFEYGVDTQVDVFIRRQMFFGVSTVVSRLHKLFIRNLQDVSILLGVLRIITRLDYSKLGPMGQIIAMIALAHENVEVKECGVRALESWGTIESLKILENFKVATPWLQEYIDTVVSDLRVQLSGG